MKATHHSGYYCTNDTVEKSLWCTICKAYTSFFKVGEHFFCSVCRYIEGTDAELTVMDE